jgi:hypothetical protein
MTGLTAGDVSVLDHRLGDLHQDVTEMKVAMKDLAAAITKLALIEERQSNAAAAMERAFSLLNKLEERVYQLESYVPANKRVSVWLDRATWAGMGLLAMLVLKKSGLL